MRSQRILRPVLAALVLSAATACGSSDPVPTASEAASPESLENPLIGHPLIGVWEVDRDGTGPGVLAMVRRIGDDRVVFEAAAVRLGDTELHIAYEIEADHVRLVRQDRDAVHDIDLLDGGQIRVHFPGGYTAVYRRADDGAGAGEG